MENKTLAFIGDSLARQQFQSLMCMITGGADRPDVLQDESSDSTAARAVKGTAVKLLDITAVYISIQHQSNTWDAGLLALVLAWCS
ncbi:protein trichome birefringence-like 16 [Nicotiana attenuata]|uniref:Protein trichome birefringence-like 16 n=1 Tax=Nicotiana attenuata TaxID=49451 RepID=A0A314KTY1_NICAT|nr:protein trichome birefringence-like 16 [Nicotiana attenuata]